MHVLYKIVEHMHFLLCASSESYPNDFPDDLRGAGRWSIKERLEWILRVVDILGNNCYQLFGIWLQYGQRGITLNAPSLWLMFDHIYSIVISRANKPNVHPN